MVEGRYRRSHVVGQVSRGGKRWNQTPYQRFPPPPPPHAKMFYPPNPMMVNYQPMPTFLPNKNAVNCVPFPIRPPPFLPPLECLPPMPPYNQPQPVPAAPSPTIPQFHTQYEEFENMKRKGMVLNPEVEQNDQPHKLLDDSLGSPKSGDTFSSAMKSFMHSYMPTANFNSPKRTANDWSKEAVNLLEEVSAPKNSSDSVWRIPSDQKEDSLARSLRDSISYHLDVLRHIQDIKPSPYPGGNPVSPKSRNHANSDNDADDETTPAGSPTSQYSAYSAIGTKRSRKKFLSPQNPPADSGYQSSSTDSGSVVVKTQKLNALDSDVASESGFTSTGSSRPGSPGRRMLRSLTNGPPPTQFMPPLPPPIPVLPFPGFPQPPVMQVGNFTNGRSSSRESTDGDSGVVYYKHKAWITDEILGMIAVRDRLYRRMKKHPAPDIVEMYKKIRNMVVGMTRNAKRAYEKKIEDQQILQRQIGMENMPPAFIYHSTPPPHRVLQIPPTIQMQRKLCIQLMKSA